MAPCVGWPLSAAPDRECGGRPICCPWALARLLPSAVRVRSKVALHVGQSAQHGNHQSLVPVSAHGSASDRNCALASTICSTMANRSKVLRASRSIRVTVTTSPGGEAVEHFEEFVAVVTRARSLSQVNLGAARSAELRKLSVERLSVGADAGIAETAVLRMSFGYILRQP